MPPANAFDDVRRYPPPAWQQQQEEQRRRQAQQTAGPQPKGKPGGKAKPAQGSGKTGGQSAKKKPQKQKQVNPAKRRRRRRIAAVAAIVVLIALGAWFSVTVLFKINKYDIQGDVTLYSEEQIIEAFGHTLGDNLYGFSVGAAEERLTTTLPYIEVAEVRRRPPSTVVLRLTTAQEAYYLLWENAYVVLNDSGKVLRTTGEVPEGVVRIDGLTSLVVEAGHPIRLDEAAAQAAIEAKKAEEAAASASAAAMSGSDVSASASVSSEAESLPDSAESLPAEDADQSVSGEPGSAPEAQPEPQQEEKKPDPALAAESFEVLWQLMEALDESGLVGITWLDVSDPLELRFNWQDRITVRLGPKSGIEEKMKFLVTLLTDGAQDGITEGDRGTLDMTLYLTTGQSYFTPE